MIRKRAQLAKNGSFPLSGLGYALKPLLHFIMQTFQFISIKFNTPINDKTQAENKAHSNLFSLASARKLYHFWW